MCIFRTKEYLIIICVYTCVKYLSLYVYRCVIEYRVPSYESSMMYLLNLLRSDVVGTFLFERVILFCLFIFLFFLFDLAL